MTITSTERRAGPFTGTGALVSYPFAFPVHVADDVAVTVADANGIETTGVLGSTFLVTLNANQSTSPGGSVQYAVDGTAAALPSGYILAVHGDTAYSQEADLPQGGAYNSVVMEKALDRLAMQIQQLKGELDRAVRVTVLSPLDTDASLPIPEAAALIGWSPDGKSLRNYDADTTVSTDVLRAELALASGAGLNGYSPALAYLQQTLGWALQLTGVSPKMFGAVDGADSTTALLAWAASAFPKIGDPGAVYITTQQLTFAAGKLAIDGRGMTIIGAAGTYPDFAVIYNTGSLSALPDLASDVAKGARTLPFASAHALTAGRVGLIYNPADGSWPGAPASAAFTYSRAGEFFRVAHVSSATDVKLDNVLWDGYAAAAVDTYLMADNKVEVKGLTLIAPGSGGIRPLRIRLATRVRLSAVDCSGADLVGLDLDRCYDFNIEASNVDNRRQVAAATYGLSIGNCQDGVVQGGNINATRHATNIGGDDVVGCVPNRNVTVRGATLRNDSALALVPCCDVHANAEAIVYSGNTIFGGASLGGKDVTYRGNTFEECAVAVGAMIQGGSMWIGGRAVVADNVFKASGAYANGLIRLFVDPANTKYDSHLFVRDNQVSLGTTDVCVRLDNSHASLKGNAVVDGLDFLDCASLSNILRMTGTGTGAYARVFNVANAKSGAALLAHSGGYTVTSVKLMPQEGVVVVTSDPAQPSASTSVTFPLSYGTYTPVMTLVLDQMTINTKTPVPRVGSVSGAGFGAYIKSGDNVAFGGAATAVNAHWTARV